MSSRYEHIRRDNLRTIRALRPYLHVKGWVHVQHMWVLRTVCKHCGLDSMKPPAQLLAHDCACKRVAKLSATNATSPARLKEICRLASVHLLGTYQNMNTAIEAQCKKCDHKWKAYVGNLRKGHGCQKCGAAKAKITIKKRYGVSSTLLVPKIRAKRRRTMLERYGVEHALQNKELYEKNVTTAYGWHPHRLGRRTVYVQGYEPQALDWILSKGVKPSQIVCGRGADVPQIRYSFEGVRSLKYFPDIWIPHLNRLVEVKSEYTFTSSLSRNLAKRDAAVRAGYDFVFLVMDKHGNRLPQSAVKTLLRQEGSAKDSSRPTKGVRPTSKGRP